MGRGILQRLTFATRLLAVISSWSELERGAPEDSCRTRLSELQLLNPTHAPLHPHGLQQPRPAPHPFGGYLEAAVECPAWRCWISGTHALYRSKTTSVERTAPLGSCIFAGYISQKPG